MVLGGYSFENGKHAEIRRGVAAARRISSPAQESRASARLLRLELSNLDALVAILDLDTQRPT